MKRHLKIAIVMIGCSLSLFGVRSSAQSFRFNSIDVPCSACPGGIARSTTAYGINPDGDIVGTYTDAVGGQHGFLLSGGQFTTIDVPGSLVGATGTLPTTVRGIDPAGDIVGSFTAPVSTAAATSPAYCPAATSTYCIKGFLYKQGKFSLVLFPGHVGAIAQRITPTGDIYGCLHDFDMKNSMYGFGMTRFGDTSLKTDGGELADPTRSVPASMNNGATPDGSTIVGLYMDLTTGLTHGYLIQNGSFEPFNVPGSNYTAGWDINFMGEVVGAFQDTSGKFHGYLRTAGGYTTLDFPGAIATKAAGINPAADIVGNYTDSSGHTHGFLAVRSTQQ
jgi:probable HAF family extracellular repeat protein